jgi:hypothetical protein
VSDSHISVRLVQNQEVIVPLCVNGRRCGELQISERCFWTAWRNCERALSAPTSRITVAVEMTITDRPPAQIRTCDFL